MNELTAFARLFEFRAVSRWLVLGLIVGTVSGLGAAGFFLAMDALRHFVFSELAHMAVLEPGGEHSVFTGRSAGELRYWVVVLAPALGGLASGLIVSRFCPEAEGHGTDALIDAFHHKRGSVRARVPLIKGLASVMVLGTGGSAGREGPIAQIGAGFGTVVARLFRLSVRERRLLLLAGAAGGIGAIFRSPLGGALFVAEVLYQDDFEVDALIPALLSSVMAYSVFTLFFGSGAIFTTEAHYSFDPRQLPLYLLLGVASALAGWLHIKVFYAAKRRLFGPLRLAPALKPALGGLAVGLIALFAPQALGAGYGWLQEAILPNPAHLPLGWLGAGVLLAIALLKIFTTALSVSSGGSGGVFGPSIVIGGMLGGGFGLACHQLFPNVVSQPGAFAIVGMACFFGGVAHVPISSLVMASEMTGNYDLLVPIMLAEGVVIVMLRRFSLYEKQVPTRRDSPAHGAEFALDVLQHVTVARAIDPHRTVETVDPSTPLATLFRRIVGVRQAVFPVVDATGRASGLVTLEGLKAYLYDDDLGRVAIAADCLEPLVWVRPDDTLAQALERFASSHHPELPVMHGHPPDQLVGMLSYEELLHAYNRELARRRAGDG
jgi:CIC family chloride channel protein